MSLRSALATFGRTFKRKKSKMPLHDALDDFARSMTVKPSTQDIADQKNTLSTLAQQALALSAVAEAEDRRVISGACSVLAEALTGKARAEPMVNYEDWRWLARWPELLINCLQDDYDNARQLVCHILEPLWSGYPSQDTIHELLARLNGMPDAPDTPSTQLISLYEQYCDRYGVGDRVAVTTAETTSSEWDKNVEASNVLNDDEAIAAAGAGISVDSSDFFDLVMESTMTGYVPADEIAGGVNASVTSPHDNLTIDNGRQSLSVTSDLPNREMPDPQIIAKRDGAPGSFVEQFVNDFLIDDEAAGPESKDGSEASWDGVANFSDPDSKIQVPESTARGVVDTALTGNVAFPSTPESIRADTGLRTPLRSITLDAGRTDDRQTSIPAGNAQGSANYTATNISGGVAKTSNWQSMPVAGSHVQINNEAEIHRVDFSGRNATQLLLPGIEVLDSAVSNDFGVSNLSQHVSEVDQIDTDDTTACLETVRDDATIDMFDAIEVSLAGNAQGVFATSVSVVPAGSARDETDDKHAGLEDLGGATDIDWCSAIDAIQPVGAIDPAEEGSWSAMLDARSQVRIKDEEDIDKARFSQSHTIQLSLPEIEALEVMESVEFGAFNPYQSFPATNGVESNDANTGVVTIRDDATIDMFEAIHDVPACNGEDESATEEVTASTLNNEKRPDPYARVSESVDVIAPGQHAGALDHVDNDQGSAEKIDTDVDVEIGLRMLGENGAAELSPDIIFVDSFDGVTAVGDTEFDLGLFVLADEASMNPDNNVPAIVDPGHLEQLARPVNQESTTTGLEQVGSPATARGKDQQAQIQLRVQPKLVDKMIANTGESIALTGWLRDRLRIGLEDARAMFAQFERQQQLGGELDDLVELKHQGGGHAQQGHQFGADATDHYDELRSTTHQLMESAADTREMGRAIVDHLARLDEMLISQEALNREDQETVLKLRTLDVKSVFQSLEQTVRQTNAVTDKQVELHLTGGNTAIDGEALNRISDSLAHLIRNAIDHGIEESALRLRRGKPAVGNIHFDFQRDGDEIVIQCRDDGAGLDYDAIRREGEGRGLIGRGASVAALKQLILKANFPTRAQVTPISPQKFGLNAVRDRVSELGGTITVDSEIGLGCCFEIRLPRNPISRHSVLVRAGSNVVALASRGVERIVNGLDGALQSRGDEMFFQAGDNTYPATTLEAVIDANAERRADERHARTVLLIRTEEGITAVSVEAVIGSRDIVVQSLDKYLPKLPGIIGATILGDGRVAPVIDLPDLLASWKAAADDRAATRAVSPSENDEGFVLVVDDSLSARRALEQCMQDAGYRVRTACDGVEATQILDGVSPDLVLADFEMPRMNGIELTAYMRSSIENVDVPVIMVTSLSAEKHLEQAEAAGVNGYLTKPYSEDVLIDTVRRLIDEAQAKRRERPAA